MKLICFFIFLLPFYSFAQVGIVNENLTDSSEKILYVGIDNVLRVISDSKNIGVAISGGGVSFIRIAPLRYSVRVSSGSEAIITVIRNNKPIKAEKFKIHLLGSSKAILGNSEDSLRGKKEIRLNPFLKVIIPKCYFRHEYRVIDFQARFNYGHNDTSSLSAQGNRLSPQQIDLINKLERGSKIYFDNIRAATPDGRIVTLSPFIIVIKD